MTQNIILNTDSYKTSHWVQYPEATEGVFSYIESRGGAYEESVVFGLQAYLKEYLSKPVTQEDIDEAEDILKQHGVPFNKDGWQYIVDKYDGYLPVRIKAVPEGTVVPIGNAIVTIENTDPALFWLTSYLETSLLRAVWYPTTVATVSFRIKQVIKTYMEDTGADMTGLSFKLHDFGSRGVSSLESAGIGGAAHLVNFCGTDTIVGLTTAMKYYNCKEVPGLSIPAAEHSTITSWGKKNEANAYSNMIKQYKDNGIMAVVSDSYDIYKAADVIWGQQLAQEVIDSGAIIVIRPDSGNPVEVVSKVLEILANRFGYETNKLGYKLLNNVRIIQGDGINEPMIRQILARTTHLGFSADNLAFGMGGALLQHMDRDTMQWAMKCSAMKISGKWKDVYKEPVGMPSKNSKRGRLTLGYSYLAGEVFTFREEEINEEVEELLEVVFEDGHIVKEYTFEEVRRNSERALK
jgi:nicotinamide phosphoribosyltransferase